MPCAAAIVFNSLILRFARMLCHSHTQASREQQHLEKKNPNNDNSTHTMARNDHSVEKKSKFYSSYEKFLRIGRTNVSCIPSQKKKSTELFREFFPPSRQFFSNDLKIIRPNESVVAVAASRHGMQRGDDDAGKSLEMERYLYRVYRQNTYVDSIRRRLTRQRNVPDSRGCIWPEFRLGLPLVR